ncbi:hypothetical protein ACSQ67_006351 [Phaseolus vulgaris]
MCDFLENLKLVFDTSTILTREYRPGSLKAYIEKMLSSIGKVRFVDRIKHMMANKIAIVVGDTTLDNVRIRSDRDEHDASILVAKRKRMKDDVIRMKEFDDDCLCSDAKSLLGKVTTLVCLANVNAKERKKAKDKKAHQSVDLQKQVSRL